MQKEIVIHYREYSMEELTEEERRLMLSAIQATDTAYAPYSHFHVGAAVLLDDGTIVSGSNQENIAYPSGLCAERTALFAASAQHPGRTMKMIAIVGRDTAGRLTAASPCGACRQVMAEQESRQGEKLSVLCYHSDSKIAIFEDIESLLPFNFTM